MGICVPCRQKAMRNEAKLQLAKDRAISYAKEKELPDVTIVFSEDEGEVFYSFLKEGEALREGYAVYGFIPLFA